jgi:thiaminase (transcriptional activator TenA)
MSFTQGLWQDIRPVYGAILDHPFIRELAAGTLAREQFVFYMKQDALYLADFARALAIAGARLPRDDERQSFLGFASGVAIVEQALHETYFKEFEVTPDSEKAPACFAYTQYLLATAALGPYSEAVAALLPCFWIYREVGSHIHAQAAGDLDKNPYGRWIATYAGEGFDASVRRAIEIVESIAGQTGEPERELMRRAFERSSRLEWRFWDSAYQLERWQPEV